MSAKLKLIYDIFFYIIENGGKEESVKVCKEGKV
jgi:hypothetical protein